MRNRKIAKLVASYCAKTRSELMATMDVVTYDENEGYLGFKRTPEAKILAVAHIDFVGTGKVHKLKNGLVISSALDDRAGVCVALELLPAWGIKADVLLTDNEESGLSSIVSVGYEMLSRYNWIVELDRQGSDAVSYGFAPDIDDYLTGHFPVGLGSYTDICELEQTSPVAAFNMGVAYHRQHTESCFLKASELRLQLDKLRGFYDRYADTPILRDHEKAETRDTRTAYDRWAIIEDDDWADEIEADRRLLSELGEWDDDLYFDGLDKGVTKWS